MLCVGALLPPKKRSIDAAADAERDDNGFSEKRRALVEAAEAADSGTMTHAQAKKAGAIFRDCVQILDTRIAACRVSTLDEREAALDERKATLDTREAALDERKAAIDTREATLSGLQSNLVAKEGLLDVKQQLLHKRKRAAEDDDVPYVYCTAVVDDDYGDYGDYGDEKVEKVQRSVPRLYDNVYYDRRSKKFKGLLRGYDGNGKRTSKSIPPTRDAYACHLAVEEARLWWNRAAISATGGQSSSSTALVVGSTAAHAAPPMRFSTFRNVFWQPSKQQWHGRVRLSGLPIRFTSTADFSDDEECNAALSTLRDDLGCCAHHPGEFAGVRLKVAGVSAGRYSLRGAEALDEPEAPEEPEALEEPEEPEALAAETEEGTDDESGEEMEVEVDME